MRSTLFFASVLTAALLSVVPRGYASEPADELIQKGDVFYAKLEPTEALKYYLPAEKLEPENAALLIRIARQYRHLMCECRSDDNKLQYANSAVGYAQRAVTLAPNDAEAQLAVAISYGKRLPLVGSKQQVADSRVIKAAADRVLALDVENDLGWQVLGRWYLGFAEVGPAKRALAQLVFGKLPPAKFEDAQHCFEKAIALNPNRLMHYIELGRTYADMGNVAEARKYILKGLSMPPTEKDDPETKDRGRQILASLH